MTGIDDLLAESNDRWSRAMRNARGVEDIGLGPAVKTYYTRYFPVGVLVLTAAGAAAALLGFTDPLDDWGLALSVGLLLAAVGAVVGGLVYNAKKVAPAAQLNKTEVLIPLDSGERQQIQRQIMGKAAIVQERLCVARAGAVQMRKSLATQLLLTPAYLLVFASQTLNWVMRGDPFGWVMAVVLVGFMVAIAQLIREFRRTGRFLAGTSED
ncbi:hypothetical protein [Arthrobacter sp. H35-D1]|uniref:hypothetical protein n=1 Tax=Arthrobacter sp. H35-D1 TaxID=3046202 RepID=UPI0024B938C8|nr:hypothetical protein [Arthrobacter sp. H35-D1]MDJ0313420.1 hypothetical protein [Arthrobacter sp. H35-D1]